MVNEAALLAARRNRTSVTMADFEDAKDKVLMGPERKSMLINETEKRWIAFHEAGHTLVNKLTPGTDPIQGDHHAAWWRWAPRSSCRLTTGKSTPDLSDEPVGNHARGAR